MNYSRNHRRAAGVILALAALLLLATPVFAGRDDYGVNIGDSTISQCGGAGEPSCTLNVFGYGLSYMYTEPWGDHVYIFDDFACIVWVHPNGGSSGRGPECDQYQPDITT